MLFFKCLASVIDEKQSFSLGVRRRIRYDVVIPGCVRADMSGDTRTQRICLFEWKVDQIIDVDALLCSEMAWELFQSNVKGQEEK